MSSTTTVTEIWINKKQLDQTLLHKFTIELDALEENQVLLETESFGFSANNITYAAFGERMGYWGFFPADEEHGILPIWGFARVIASRHADVKVGEKVFGYLPFASHLVAEAGKVTKHGFSDVAEKRKSINPVYDNYLFCATDPGYDPKKEPWQLNYRPLFMTSFVLDDYVGENLDENVNTVFVTSASSKTGYGAAHLLRQHKATRGSSYQVVGLTSSTNIDFVDGLDCFDKVYSYDELDQLHDVGTFTVLDFAANGDLLAQLKSLADAELRDVVLIGATDWQASEKPDMKSLTAEIFFAPAQVKKRMGEWGQGGFLQRYAQAWMSFAKQIDNKMNVTHYQGAEEMTALYKATLGGAVDVKAMNVVTF